jgi:hypothetical protein
MADGFGYSSGYSPYTGAGNLALAMGANPSFGGYTGGYQSGGYTPSNVGGVNYSSSAPSGYAWSASGLVPIGTGQAGVQAYNPAIATSPTRSFQIPSFTNSMSNWNPGGYAGLNAYTDYYGGDSSGGSVDASSFDQYSRMSDNSGQRGGTYSPLGTAAANAAAWPNPDMSMSATPSNRYTTQNIMAGLFSGEDPNNTTGNPYQMMPSAMSALRQWGTPMPAPTNPQASYNAANAFIGGMQQHYNLPYAEQVATAYGPSGIGNVNRSYNPNLPGSTPYINNVSQNAAGNQTPQAYLYGNSATGYPGVMAGMRQSAANDAVTSQFQQAAGAGQQPFMNSLYPQQSVGHGGH